MSNRILADVHQLILKKSAQAREALKKRASPADPIDQDNGTTAVTTGQHYNDNVEAAKTIPASAESSKAVPVGETLKNDVSDKPVASATDGSAGADNKGGEFSVTGMADSGSSDLDAVMNKTSAVVLQLRKLAEDLGEGELVNEGQKGDATGDEPVTPETNETGPVADAKPEDTEGTEGGKEAMEKVAAARKVLKGYLAPKKAAASQVSGFDRFLAAVGAQLPMVKKAMDEGQQVDPAAAAEEALVQGLSTGEIDDAQAEQILMEAVESGAISPDELQEAISVLEGGAALEDPEAALADVPPEGDVPPAAEEMLQAKTAAVNALDPNSPDYVSRVVSLFPDAYQYAYKLAAAVADDIIAAEEAAAGEGSGAPAGEGEGEGEGEGAPVGEGEGEGAPAGDGELPPEAAAMLPEEGAALTPQTPEEEAVLQEILAQLPQLDGAQAGEMLGQTKMASAKRTPDSYRREVCGVILSTSLAARAAKK